MPQYMLSVHHDEDEVLPTGEDAQALYRQVGAFNEELTAAGSWVFACGLHDAASATVVTATDGDPIVTDGLFAETKEYLGGFWIVAADDLDAALEWARKGSVACRAPVEVRPLQGE